MFDWWVLRPMWLTTGRVSAAEELTRLLRRVRPIGLSDALEAIDQADEVASQQQRREVPWYFSSEERFLRWLTITAMRGYLGAPVPPLRFPIPMLQEMDDPPLRSILLYHRCDSFRLAYDLPHVFRVSGAEASRLLREADRVWNELFRS
jgi:hypothetical protein